jgi:hypothetical protein
VIVTLPVNPVKIQPAVAVAARDTDKPLGMLPALQPPVLT